MNIKKIIQLTNDWNGPIIQTKDNEILCSTVLKNGRFVIGSWDKSIIIYNNKTFKSDLIIKEHKIMN